MPRADFEKRIARVLETRVDRIVLCLECVTDNKNYLASLRTCDVLGVQRVVVIHPSTTGDSNSGDAPKVEQGRKKIRIARASSSWLDIQHFNSTAAAIQALKAEGWTIWATDLNPGAAPLTTADIKLPPQLAIVMGSESSGISSEMRAAADKCVYLPMYGFTESLNVGVASGLVLQALIAAEPGVRGQLVGEGRAQQLTDKWRAAASRGGPETWPGATVTQAQLKQQKQQQQQQQLEQQTEELQQQQQQQGKRLHVDSQQD